MAGPRLDPGNGEDSHQGLVVAGNHNFMGLADQGLQVAELVANFSDGMVRMVSPIVVLFFFRMRHNSAGSAIGARICSGSRGGMTRIDRDLTHLAQA